MVDENGRYNRKKVEEQLAKFDFLKLNLQESEDLENFPHYAGKALYWKQVWNNLQIRVIADNENILNEIIDEKKGINPNFEVINLKLQYIQKNGIAITSSKTFRVLIDNYY